VVPLSHLPWAPFSHPFHDRSKTADALIKEHPAPHRLKLFLQVRRLRIHDTANACAS
jgi:hypothetical protein